MLTRRQLGSVAIGGAALTLGGGAAAANLTPGKDSRRSEVRALRAFAEKIHPRGREAAANPDWQRRWTMLEQQADAMTDGAYLIGTRRALGWFADGHTTPLPFEFAGGVPDKLKSGPFGRILPLTVQLFHDAALVTGASAPFRGLLGRPVDAIGSMKTAEIVREFAKEWPGNMAWAHRWAGFALVSPAQLQGLGVIRDTAAPIRLTIAGQAVAIPTALIAAENSAVTRPKTRVERWSSNAGRGNFVRPIPDHGAIYVSIDDMADVEGATFEQFTRDIFAAMGVDGIGRIVIDLRRNGGGNNFLPEALRKHVAASRFNRPGRLYVLTGPQTFSAAQNLATRLERETFAIFVGEPTGGRPNHYGDAEPFVGPVTGLTSIVSTLAWFDSYPKDDRPWILPDLAVPSLSTDWLAGNDPALDLALSHRVEGKEDELHRNRIFFYERPSQSLDWRPFWRAG